jgi:hypothetical protein
MSRSGSTAKIEAIRAILGLTPIMDREAKGNAKWMRVSGNLLRLLSRRFISFRHKERLKV